MNISCLIFDVDGTLLDNTKYIIQIFQDLLIKYLGSSYSMTSEEVLGLWGPPGDVIFHNIYPPEIVNVAWGEFLDLYRKNHPKAGFFTSDELSNLRKYVEYLAIFTGKGRQTNSITLDVLGLNDCFDVIFTGNDVVNSKPDPEALFQILDILMLDKNEVLFIGDSYLDINAGKAAGILTAGVLWGAVETKKLIDSKPDYIFKTPSEFISFVQEQN
ncbi:MAG: HAD-IA family hydrolase [Candidatus Heimdallarchaeota archaeon]|nr:HAD-IA family hydrolase [Candidatus Heimdallarchaeota archaeon]